MTLRFSSRAEADLLQIGNYGVMRWGMVRAATYLDLLDQACATLAQTPGLGRPCDHIRPGLYRLEAGKHVLFHRRTETGILVVRILHQGMLPQGQSWAEEG